MADPIAVECPADVWTNVAIGVNSGTVTVKNNEPGVYKHTYRDTGAAAPAGNDDAIPFEKMALISSSFLIDVYVMPVDDDGEVIVALP